MSAEKANSAESGFSGDMESRVKLHMAIRPIKEVNENNSNLEVTEWYLYQDLKFDFWRSER